MLLLNNFLSQHVVRNAMYEVETGFQTVLTGFGPIWQGVAGHHSYEAFPPTPPDPLLRRKIIDEFCKATSPSKFEEVGCAICGSLTLQSDISEFRSLTALCRTH